MRFRGSGVRSLGFMGFDVYGLGFRPRAWGIGL